MKDAKGHCAKPGRNKIHGNNQERKAHFAARARCTSPARAGFHPPPETSKPRPIYVYTAAFAILANEIQDCFGDKITDQERGKVLQEIESRLVARLAAHIGEPSEDEVLDMLCAIWNDVRPTVLERYEGRNDLVSKDILSPTDLPLGREDAEGAAKVYI